MKQLILILSIFSIFSCSPKLLNVEVEYYSGEKDTICYIPCDIVLHKGCIYSPYNYEGEYACEIKNFKILEK